MAVGRVLGVLPAGSGVVNVVKFHGSVGAPAPHHGGGLGSVIGHIPAHALHGHVNPQLPQLVGRILRQGLADGIPGGIHQGKSGPHAVLFPEAVLPHDPARLIQKPSRLIGVILHLRCLVVPGHFCAHAVGRRAVAVQHVLNHLLPVDADVDGPAHIHVAGKVISQRHAVFICGFRGDGRKIKAPVVHRLKGQKLIAVHSLIGVGSRRVGHVRLSGHHRRERRVLLHKQDSHPLHLRRLPVIIRIGLKDDLLLPVPLLQHIPAGTDGILTVIRPVGVLRHDPHNGHGVGPDGKGPGHVEYHCGVIGGLGVVQHGEVVDRAGGLHGVVGEGHVRRRQGLPVGKLHVVPDIHRPGQAILTHLHIRGQIIADLQVRRGHRQSTLNQGLMDVFSRSPAVSRIKAFFRLRLRCHNNHDGILLIGFRSLVLCLLSASGQCCRQR